MKMRRGPVTAAGVCTSLLLLIVGGSATALAQETTVDERATVSVLNRVAYVQGDGSWVIPNVPATGEPVRARLTLFKDGQTVNGTSDYFVVRPNIINSIPPIVPGEAAQVPQKVGITGFNPSLSSMSSSTALVVTATYPDGTTRNVTLRVQGTSYTTSNSRTATVSDDGVVTALTSGRVLITASNEGAVAAVEITAVMSADSDGDGMPDDFELANNLDPNDPADAFEDPDADGLSNVEEFLLGTFLRNADSDADGIADGEEIVPGADGFTTSPVLFDTDGDGVWDATEIAVGTDPTNAGSVNYARVLEAFDVSPKILSIVVNTVLLQATSQPLRVTGRMIDGNFIDLTSGRGTLYTTSNAAVAGVTDQDGRVLAFNPGAAIITAANGRFSATSSVTVTTFSPTALSFIPIPGYANGVAVEGNLAYVASGAAGLTVVEVSDPSRPTIVGSVNTPGNANDVRVLSGVAYVADGPSGLQIIDVRSPGRPVIVGSVETPGIAMDLALAGGRAYVADGPCGLEVIDVSNLSSPVRLGSVDTPGIAKGVDVSGSLVVVADGSAGIHIIDASNPSLPLLIGSMHTRPNSVSSASDVVVRQRLAFVADGADGTPGGMRIVDFTNPANPFVAGASSDQFGLVGAALDLSLALGADYLFANAVPIFDVGSGVPIFTGALDFSQAPSFRDDNGTGIAVRDGLVFLTAARNSIKDNGEAGDTGLHIGRYLLLADLSGIAPSVRITSPPDGSTAKERSLLKLQVIATDDVFVASVQFQVDGRTVFTDVSAPYEFEFEAPSGVAGFTVSAVATDVASNQAAATPVRVTVLPNANPSVVLTSPKEGSAVTEGMIIPITANATDDVAVSEVRFFIDGILAATVSAEPYRFDFTVPFGITEFSVSATATDNTGNFASAGPVAVNVVPNAGPSIQILEPSSGDQVVERSILSIVVGAVDPVGIQSVRFFVDGAVRAEDFQAPYEFDLVVPTAVQQLRIAARALNTAGQEVASPEIVVQIIPDPLTTVEGVVFQTSGAPAAGARVSVFEFIAIADAQGFFSIPNVPTAQGNISAQATFVGPLGTFLGVSDPAFPIPAGRTNVGTIVVSRRPDRAVVADDNNASIHILDVANLRVSSTFSFFQNFGTSGVGDMALKPDGKTLLVANDFGFSEGPRSKITQLDLSTDPPSFLSSNTIPHFVNDLKTTPDGQFALFAGNDGFGGARLSSLGLIESTFSNLITNFPRSIAFVPESRRILSVTRPHFADNDFLQIFTLSAEGILNDTGTFVPIPTPFGSQHVVLSPDHTLAIVAWQLVFFGSPGSGVEVFRVEPDGTIVHAKSINTLFGARATAFHPDGRRAYVHNSFDQSTGDVGVLEIDVAGDVTDTGVRIGPIRGLHTAGFFRDTIAVTPGGTRVLVRSVDSVAVINVETNAVEGTIPVPAGGEIVTFP